MDGIIYVGAAPTNGSPGLKQSIPRFKQLLREKTDTIVLRWVGEDTVIDNKFFARDLGNVRMCDVMIAIVDEPSIGLGIELAQAMNDHKPTLCLYQVNNSVSRMVQVAAKDGRLHLAAYKDMYDAANIASVFIKTTLAKVEA